MIYLDHHAATPLDARVARAMDAARARAWANPSSVHGAGRESRAVLEGAREAIARALGANANDLVLTSGGTEACNLAVAGVLAREGRDAHVVTTSIEHPAVSAPIAAWQSERGGRVTQLAVPHGVAPTADALREAITEATRLVAIQWVNHETGTVLPVSDYARVCREARVPLFVDATQALGKLPLHVAQLGADLVACASHKIGGPSGSGVLWVRRELDLRSLIHGGSQERGRRGGTPDVVAHAGFGAACELLPERLEAQPRIAALRDRLEGALLQAARSLRIELERNAGDGPRVGTVSNLSVRGWRGEALVAALDVEGLCVSSGAACSSGKSEPSPVLRAMHAEQPWRAGAALRLSFGVETTEIETESALAVLSRVLSRPPA